MRHTAAGIALAAALVAALAACVASPAPVADHAWLPDAVARRVQRNPPLGAPPPDPTNRWADSVAAAEFGHLLFFDERLSASGTVSCASCHMPERGFSDPRPVAVGEGTGTRHSMTVLNAAHQRWLTWDGRADTLWSQAVQPFEAAHEMNMPRDRVLGVVAGDGALRAAWHRARIHEKARQKQRSARFPANDRAGHTRRASRHTSALRMQSRASS